ncbi:hypothetical protein DPMN_057957 [Dreissena polymorpha]|uniref:Uncharacterized protein n=1 Tax=Dreissena polymorpha TaxID=45954 RepID=A0A9D4HFK8_DREPO|nr:hypothetical protein DPMN_057957 [Dreissena polymorpha]
MESVKKHRRVQYRCNRCQKTDRKGRLMAHIFKHHVPFDEAHFSCSLCSFRCQTQQHLIDHITKYAPHVKEAKARGVTDLRRYLIRSENPYTVSEADIKRLGDSSLEQYIEETDEGWFDVQEDTPLLPDWLSGSGPLVQSPMTLPLRPVVSSNIRSRPRTTSPLTSGWVVPATALIYRPTPKAACPMVALQVPAVSLAIPTAALPGTPLQDELVLRRDDDYNLDFLEEEPLVPLAFTSSSAATTASEEGRHPPAKQARLSPVPPANACNEERKRSQIETADAAESEKLQILRNLQKMASDMTSGVDASQER